MAFEWDKRFPARLAYVWKLPSGEIVGMARKYGRGRHLVQFVDNPASVIFDDMTLFYHLTNYGKGGQTQPGALHYWCGPQWSHAKAVSDIACEVIE